MTKFEKDRGAIERLRTKLGWSKKEFEIDLGLSRQSYYELIRGITQEVSPKVLRRLDELDTGSKKGKLEKR